MNNWANSNPDEAAAGVEPRASFVGKARADDIRHGLTLADAVCGDEPEQVVDHAANVKAMQNRAAHQRFLSGRDE